MDNKFVLHLFRCINY